METFKSFERDLYEVNADTFPDIAYRIFRYQAKENKTYQQYLQYRKIDPTKVSKLEEIPFLPISLYKQYEVVTGSWIPEKIFLSSGTTGSIPSMNRIFSLSLFEERAKRIFEDFFEPVENYHILALLPSYLERGDSSLVYMVNHLIKESGSNHSSFYLHNVEELVSTATLLKGSPKRVMIWGVTYALLDLANRFPFDASHCVLVETGGMKGRGKEMVREEVHQFLHKKLGAKSVFTEYGMTELTSMAYTDSSGIFRCPNTMKVYIRDLYDPFAFFAGGEHGGINVIDLANYATCS
ncbi:MAG: long-chain fatty acid--CoA ligase, partial [Flammeovirgaceae bacterium]|nr:long-chain fatty acid--CoA ligase [Flammeovirgaceae bacterium]